MFEKKNFITVIEKERVHLSDGSQRIVIPRDRLDSLIGELQQLKIMYESGKMLFGSVPASTPPASLPRPAMLEECPMCLGKLGHTDLNFGWIDCERCHGEGVL